MLKEEEQGKEILSLLDAKRLAVDKMYDTGSTENFTPGNAWAEAFIKNIQIKGVHEYFYTNRKKCCYVIL